MKLIAVDNFDRDTYDDVLVCENIAFHDCAEAMCEALNTRCAGNYSETFYKVVDDDYVLREYDH